MKSLLDIQQDIRRLEKCMQEISEDMQTINSDIDSLRNTSETTEGDFSKIETLARQIDFDKHPLSKLNDNRVCRVYLEMLLNLVRLDADEETTVNRLVFIQWLQIQSRIDYSLEDLYKECFKTDKKIIFEFLEIMPEEYKEYFLVDALIVANISGEANAALLNYIADIIDIFGLAHEKVKELAIISKMVLSQSVDGIKREYLNRVDLESFSHYIRNDIVQDILNTIRVIAVAVRDSSVYSFSWTTKQFQEVKCGDIIAKYRKNWMYGSDPEKVKAPVSGTIFQFKYNNTYYGVISYENDNKDSIKSWVKMRRG